MKISKLTYVTEAENVIKSLQVQNRRTGEYELRLTTSKIRNLLAMVSELYTSATHFSQNALDTELQSRVQYLRLRLAYEAGRDTDVKTFVEKAKLLDIVNEVGQSK